jgi:hypothetical protein
MLRRIVAALAAALIDGPLPVALSAGPATRPPALSETRSGGEGHAPRNEGGSLAAPSAVSPDPLPSAQARLA